MPILLSVTEHCLQPKLVETILKHFIWYSTKRHWNYHVAAVKWVRMQIAEIWQKYRNCRNVIEIYQKLESGEQISKFRRSILPVKDPSAVRPRQCYQMWQGPHGWVAAQPLKKRVRLDYHLSTTWTQLANECSYKGQHIHAHKVSRQQVTIWIWLKWCNS